MYLLFARRQLCVKDFPFSSKLDVQVTHSDIREFLSKAYSRFVQKLLDRAMEEQHRPFFEAAN